ncbi:hypothetical protein AVEN_152592-1 [Araneus ventricosus]|uniref:Uncharacterized protein n=1 Tax=Araneus ventricosus TaxID=182803 RepID=A0A4Y2FYU7_ARAVE|nr:hypothetical protein AVEN_152592-1 [Araneus ventricosus]
MIWDVIVIFYESELAAATQDGEYHRRNLPFNILGEESISHMFFRYPRFDDSRLQLLKGIPNLNPVNPLLLPKPIKFGQEFQHQAEIT